MHAYIGIKPILAIPMSLGGYNHYRGWNMPENKDLNTEGYLVEYEASAKNPSNHPEHAGYISWSPKEAFDASHTRTDSSDYVKKARILAWLAKYQSVYDLADVTHNFRRICMVRGGPRFTDDTIEEDLKDLVSTDQILETEFANLKWLYQRAAHYGVAFEQSVVNEILMRLQEIITPEELNRRLADHGIDIGEAVHIPTSVTREEDGSLLVKAVAKSAISSDPLVSDVENRDHLIAAIINQLDITQGQIDCTTHAIHRAGLTLIANAIVAVDSDAEGVIQRIATATDSLANAFLTDSLALDWQKLVKEIIEKVKAK